MSTYTELMMKMANGEKLDPLEKEQLRQYTSEIDNNRQIVSTWQSIDGKVLDRFINFPIKTIYSTLLVENVASINVQIPSTFSHLLILGAGKSTAATADLMAMRFNGDSGSNYSYQYFQRASTTTSGGQDLSITQAPLGEFIDTSDDTLSASFFCIIPHYRSSYYKTTMTFTNFRNPSFRYVKFFNSFWNDTSPISKITFLPQSGNIKAGSVFSVYGLV